MKLSDQQVTNVNDFKEMTEATKIASVAAKIASEAAEMATEAAARPPRPRRLGKVPQDLLQKINTLKHNCGKILSIDANVYGLK